MNISVSRVLACLAALAFGTSVHASFEPPAVGELDKPRLSSPDHSPNAPFRPRLSSLLKGLEHLKRDRYAEAVESFSAVIQLTPELALTYMLRGDAYLFWRKPHEAIADYDQAERRGGFESQTVVRLHVQRARCRIGIDDNEGAVNDLDAALRIAPGTVSALRWRAVAHERLGNLAQAVADYDALLQIAALSDTTSADVLAERANILLKLKLFARAAADLKQALTYTPGVLENLRRLGYAYEKAGLKDQALSTYRETADLYPGDEWTKRQLARLNRRSR